MRWPAGGRPVAGDASVSDVDAAGAHPLDLASVMLLDATPDAVEQFWRVHRAHGLIGLRTSGTTTGAARIIVRTTDSWVDSFDATARHCGLAAGDRIWIPGPMSATMNLFAACLAQHAGASWTASDPLDADIAQVTPAGLVRLLDREPSDRQQFRAAIVAGDALSGPLARRAAAEGIRVSHYYGAAELSMVAMGTSADDLHPLERVEISVRDGQIWVRSPWLCTAVVDGGVVHELARDAEGFATVGDRGRLEAGRVQVQGREGAVTTAGETVPLAPLLARMRRLAHGEVFLVGCPDPRIGQVLTAVVTESGDIDVLRRWARTELVGAQRPRRWACVPRPPVTPAGKTDLRALVEQLVTGTRGQDEGKFIR